MYFNKYPVLTYTVGKKQVELADIFARISLLREYTTENVYDDYYIQEGEYPEDVAKQIYGNDYFAWVILWANNIINEDEWYKGDGKFLEFLNKKYAGESYYITNLPDIVQGDIMVKVTSANSNTGEVTVVDESTYRVIYGFDKNFRRVYGFSGSGTFQKDDKIVFARKNSNNGSVEIIKFIDSGDPDEERLTQYTDIKFIEERKKSPLYILTVNNVSIPTNAVYASGEVQNEFVSGNTIYTNDISPSGENFARTVLYYYMTNDGVIPTTTNYTISDMEFAKFKSGQKIKIIKKQYLGEVIQLFEDLIRGNEIGQRRVIGL